MAIKFKYHGEQFTADTPEEAAKLLSILKEQDAAQAREQALKKAMRRLEGTGSLRNSLEGFAESIQNPWTLGIFNDFVGRLGARQKAVLSFLVARREATDEELRNTIGIASNQALAGVLSGISKQAAALGVPARTIFRFQNLRNAEGRRNIYTIADEFLETATHMSWPYTSPK
jgi:hypothetical protein